MIWQNLKWNIISEVIGILVTVFLVDRIIEFRRRQRWVSQRSVFLTGIRDIADNLLVAWNEVFNQLLQLKEYKSRSVISDEHRARLNKYFGFDRGIASVEGLLFPLAERNLYYRKQRKAVRDDLNEACLLLIPFLQRKLPVIYNEFWVQFISRMKNEVHRLREHLDHYGVLVDADPEIVLHVIKLSIVFDFEAEHVLDFKKRIAPGENPQPTYLLNTWAMFISDAFKSTAELYLYARRYRTYRDTSSLQFHEASYRYWKLKNKNDAGK